MVYNIFYSFLQRFVWERIPFTHLGPLSQNPSMTPRRGVIAMATARGDPDCLFQHLSVVYAVCSHGNSNVFISFLFCKINQKHFSLLMCIYDNSCSKEKNTDVGDLFSLPYALSHFHSGPHELSLFLCSLLCSSIWIIRCVRWVVGEKECRMSSVTRQLGGNT